MLNDDSIQDPFVILNISRNASDNDIRKSFHSEMLKASEEKKVDLQAAYVLIKNQESRNRYLFLDLFSTFSSPDPDSKMSSITQEDLAKLISELAFLSDWELSMEAK